MTDLSLMMVTGDILGLPLFCSVFVVESFHFYVSLQQKEVGTCLPPVLCVCVCACASTCKCPAGLPFRSADISSSARVSVLPLERNWLSKRYTLQLAQHIIDDLGDFIQPKAPNEELRLSKLRSLFSGSVTFTQTRTDTHTDMHPLSFNAPFSVEQLKMYVRLCIRPVVAFTDSNWNVFV